MKSAARIATTKDSTASSSTAAPAIDPGSRRAHGGADLVKRLGPGLITGASDDDPSGIGTYAQAGSRFGVGLLWTMVVTYPLMSGIQEISARIGIVTGRGLAGNLRAHAPRPLLYGVIAVLLAANTVNIGADVGAMGASLRLMTGGPALLWVVAFGTFSALLQVFVPYHRYVPYLKWLSVALFAYVGIAFVVQVPWRDVARATFVPSMPWSRSSIEMTVAILGTTISPYLFFWQASEEVEEQRIDGWERPLAVAPEQGTVQLGRMQADTWFGMGVSNVVAYFVMLTAAVVFHGHGIVDIQTVTQAAEVLKPVAGPFAHVLFSGGIIGTGLLALPVLAGSSAYAVGEALRWRTGLEKSPRRAARFYLVIIASMAGGVALNVLPIDPIRALVWSAVVNGVTSAPIMIAVMLLARRSDIMGEFTLPRRLQVLGWSATAVMAASAIALLTVTAG